MYINICINLFIISIIVSCSHYDFNPDSMRTQFKFPANSHKYVGYDEDFILESRKLDPLEPLKFTVIFDESIKVDSLFGYSKITGLSAYSVTNKRCSGMLAFRFNPSYDSLEFCGHFHRHSGNFVQHHFVRKYNIGEVHGKIWQDLDSCFYVQLENEIVKFKNTEFYEDLYLILPWIGGVQTYNHPIKIQIKWED